MKSATLLTGSLLALSLSPASALTLSHTAAASATGSWAGSAMGGLGSTLFFQPFSLEPTSLSQVDISFTMTLVADVSDYNPFEFDLWADPNIFMNAQAMMLGDSGLYLTGNGGGGVSVPTLLSPGEAISGHHRLHQSLLWTSSSAADLQYYLGGSPIAFQTGASLFSLSSYGGANASLQLTGEITYHYDSPPMAAAGAAFHLVPEAGASALLLALSAGALTWFIRKDSAI